MIDPLSIHALADGELNRDEAARLRQEMQSHPEAATELRAVESLKSLLKERCEAPECAEAWRGCVGRLQELDRTRRVETFVGRYAWALCTVFFLAIVTGGLFRRAGGNSPMRVDELPNVASVLANVRSPQRDKPTDFDRWVDHHLRQARVSMDERRLQVLAIAEGQMEEGLPVLRLTLRDPNGDLALMVLPKPLSTSGLQRMPGEDAYFAGSVDALNVVAWGAGDRSLVLLAPRTHESLRATAERINGQ